jgi:hypothetical protein
MVWLQLIFMSLHHHPIKPHKQQTIILLVKSFYAFMGCLILFRWILETTMYVSPAQAPYEGVYQRQPTGLPKAEFIPQYPEMPSTNGNNSAMYSQIPNGYQAPIQYPPQPAYQNNGYGGEMYVPQMNQQQVC